MEFKYPIKVRIVSTNGMTKDSRVEDSAGNPIAGVQRVILIGDAKEGIWKAWLKVYNVAVDVVGYPEQKSS